MPHQARADPDQAESHSGELLRAARAGDRDALNRLCQENWLPVYRSVARWAGTPAEAEDLTQEVFVRAIQSLGSYRGADLDIPYRAYLLRISRNLVIDRWRARQRPRSSELKNTDGCSPPSTGSPTRTAMYSGSASCAA